ncbi:MAG: DUF167 domain-containing protein [Sphingomicrobium sp.]
MTSILAIRVTTRSSNPGVGPWRNDAEGRLALEVRVTAAPTDGSANAAVIALLAKSIRISKSAITIVAGASSRQKRLSIDLEDAELERRLKALLPPSG